MSKISTIAGVVAGIVAVLIYGVLMVTEGKRQVEADMPKPVTYKTNLIVKSENIQPTATAQELQPTINGNDLQ